METEKRWYIGVDGGGTKTAVGLYDSEGNEYRSVTYSDILLLRAV